VNEDFRDLLAALLDAQVEFVVVGAFALAAHGIPRATGDIDVLVRPSPQNAARVVEALRAFGAPIDEHAVTAADFERSDTVYQIGVPPRRVDVMTGISGVTFEDAWSTRLAITIEGLTFFVLGREALIRNKLATGREKDLLDVAELTK